MSPFFFFFFLQEFVYRYIQHFIHLIFLKVSLSKNTLYYTSEYYTTYIEKKYPQITRLLQKTILARELSVPLQHTRIHLVLRDHNYNGCVDGRPELPLRTLYAARSKQLQESRALVQMLQEDRARCFLRAPFHEDSEVR